MANCPKCGVKLSKFNWKPNCPNCNVNIFYCGMEERLERDAEIADKSLTNMYNKLDIAKAGYAGSKLAIVRLVLMILPIAALFLPLAKLSINVPFVEKVETMNAISIYNALSGLDFGKAFDLFSSQAIGSSTLYFVLSLVFFAVAAVLFLVQIILLIMACSKHGFIRNLITGAVSFVCVALSGVFAMLSMNSFGATMGSAFSGSIQFGYWILLVLSALPFVINFVIKKHPIKVVFTAEKKKAEIAKKAAEMAAAEQEAKEAEEKQREIEEAYAKEHGEQ